MSEHIDVVGKGELMADTDLNQAKDSALGVGNQTYDRYFASEENGLLLLTSQYHIKHPEPKRSHYSIGLLSEDFGLQHAASVYGNGTELVAESSINIGLIKSKDSKIAKSNTLTTHLNISGTGRLSEAIINKSIKHPDFLAETWINGSFHLTSGISENIAIGNDFEKLSAKSPVDKKTEGGIVSDNSSNQGINLNNASPVGNREYKRKNLKPISGSLENGGLTPEAGRETNNTTLVASRMFGNKPLKILP